MPAQTGTTITMPQLGESVTEGTIGNWLKQVGDRIAKYEPLVEVETDKASAEIPSPLEGVVAEILIEPGTVVPVGAALCRIEPEGSAAAGMPEIALPNGNQQHNGHQAAQQPANGAGLAGKIPDETHLLHTRSSPVVRRLAEEHGIDIGEIAGTGIEGRVTKKDILAVIASASQPPAPAPVATVQREAPRTVTPVLTDLPVPPAHTSEPEPVMHAVTLFPGDEAVPVTAMRRRIAAHMMESVRTAPQATVVMEVDMTRAVAHRAAHKDSFAAQEGVPLTYLPYVIKAATLALRAHPRLNAVWDEDRIIQRRALNIGVAVGLDDGLVVPVIRDADRLSMAGLAHAVAGVSAKAHDGSFNADDLAGGTFTVNNPGTYGSLVSTPILVPPQVAILSMEAIIKRPAVVGDMIAVRSMMNLSLTIDHRALDGLAATRFLAQVRDWLEAIDEHTSLF